MTPTKEARDQAIINVLGGDAVLKAVGPVTALKMAALTAFMYGRADPSDEALIRACLIAIDQS